MECNSRVGYMKRTAMSDNMERKKKEEAQAAKEHVFDIPPEAKILPKARPKLTSIDQAAEEEAARTRYQRAQRVKTDKVEKED